MIDEHYGQDTVDLDSVPVPQGQRRATVRPRRQCAYCFANRSSILKKGLDGCQARALEALQRAHPEEYDEYLQRERDAAYCATEQAWEQHLSGKCRRAR